MGRTLSKEEIFELSAEVPVPDWHKGILDERLEDHRRNPDDSVSWGELKDELFPKR